MRTLSTVVAMFLLLTGCTDEDQNDKNLQLAKQAIEQAAVSDETIMDLPFGFSFTMTSAKANKHIDSLQQKGIISNIKNSSFDYQYPEYSGLIAGIELFFVDDRLCRLAYQVKNKDQFFEDWLKEYGKILKESYENSHKFYIPVGGLKEESHLDKVLIRTKANKVFMRKDIIYKGSEPNEIVYVYDNQPMAQNLPKYQTKKEMSLGDERIRKLIEFEIFCEENKDEIEKYIEESKPAESEKVENSPWDGSVFQVKQYLKQYLKDPKSYESLEWSQVQENGSNYIVRHKYRAKNSFGGFVIENQVFTLNKNGEVISVSNY